jgi:ATP-dependent Zn protease
MSRNHNKKIQEMSEFWRRVALTQGVPAGLIEAADMHVDERTRMVRFRNAVVARPEEPTQLELFIEARLGPEADSADGGQPDKKVSRQHNASKAIVAAALEAAMTPAARRRLKGTRPIAVVVAVPSAAWVKSVEDYFDADTSNDWATFARTGSNRSRDKSMVGNDEVARKISEGRRVVGIAANPEMILPSTLLAASDVTIKIAPPNGAVIRDALRRCLRGRSPGHIDDKLVAGLDFNDLVAAIRSDSTPKQAVERFKAAFDRRAGASQAETFPLLENAVEYGEAQKWGLELVRDLEDYRASKISWDKLNRAAIFYGDPGCGKSVLAGSLALACQLPLIRTSVADYFKGEGALGDVLMAQRAAFQKAADSAPCVFFIDEVDAIPNRATLTPRGAEWWTSFCNDGLLLIDQAMRNRVVLCGATNRIDAIDPALLRPGRFERSIEIGRPSLQGAINILRFHLGVDLASEDISDAARLAEGFTAAELMEIVRSARRKARHAQRAFTLADLRAQIQGDQNESPTLLRRLAVHEAGHAVTVVAIPIGTLCHVQLRSRGTSGGHTKVCYDDDDLTTLADVEDRVTSILSASIAERLLLGAVSTGAGGNDKSDLGVATTLLAVAYTSTNLTGNLLHMCESDSALATIRADPRLRRQVELHLRKLEVRATALVERNLEAIAAVADALAKKRYLSGNEVVAIMRTIGCTPQSANNLKLIATERS